jgi:hypothetical protein
MKIRIGSRICTRSDFGFISQTDFEKGKEECRPILVEIAKKKRRPIGYKKLAQTLASIQYPFLEDPEFRVLSDMVGELSVEEHEAERPLLSALVVNASSGSDHEGMPGPGFFNLRNGSGSRWGETGSRSGRRN